MMKISKPVLTNELLLSSVQFTSLNSIVFKNVKNVYEENEKISLEYEHSTKIEPSSRDWIGIFPHGWTTLQQYITFEWVSQSFANTNSEQNKENADLIRRAINFCPKYLMSSVNNNSFYQFVYISKQIEVLGVSSYFRFDVAHGNNRALELECLVPVSSKLRSTSISDFGILLENNLPSTTSIGTRTLQTSSIHSLQNLDPENKNWAKPPLSLNAADVKKTAFLPRKTTGTGDVLDPYTSHSEPVFPMSFQMANCKKCYHFKRGGEFLRSQQVLQSKVGPRSEGTSEFGGQRRTFGHELSENKLKIVMERNKLLEERSQEIKKEMERLQMESKKLRMSFYNANKEKAAYEKFVKDFIKSLEKDSIVRVVNGNTEILVKRVNYVGMEEHPRGKKTSKRERELKAVIGLQEITIRNLINSLQEKAKSVKELNETVKLAQAFSCARADPQDYGSDVEENLEEVSNSDVTSEYEFSLMKPQPPEESTVEDTDAVLDDIRRTSEMELKDIGISRSLGKSSSRDSDLELPNLTVQSYHNQSEVTGPKKPRLFDNLEDCWPFSDTSRKQVHRKVIESSPRMQAAEDSDEVVDENIEEDKPVDLEEIENDKIAGDVTKTEVESAASEMVESDEKPSNFEDSTNYEDYYDAYEDNESPDNPPEAEMAIFQEQNEENEKVENNNFLVTAIIPQELNMNSVDKVEDQWMKMDQEDAAEKKEETSPKKGKKFTCELSIDFSTKRNPESVKEGEQDMAAAIEDGQSGQHESGQVSEVIPFTNEIKSEKSLVTYNKANKCLEIKITQMDQKNQNKNFVHQRMVVKFGKEPHQPATTGLVKPSKFEFNLALTGIGDGSKQVKSEHAGSTDETVEMEHRDEAQVDVEPSPRTVWNDAIDDLKEEDVLQPEDLTQEEICPPTTDLETEETQSVSSEDAKGETSEKLGTNFKSYEDSLRYEKNLEFLQQKSNDRMKDEVDVTKDKPSAILIQNGQTKLALIRYQ